MILKNCTHYFNVDNDNEFLENSLCADNNDSEIENDVMLEQNSNNNITVDKDLIVKIMMNKIS